MTWPFNDIIIQASVQAMAYDVNLNDPATSVHSRKDKDDLVHVHEDKVDLFHGFINITIIMNQGKYKFNITANDLAVR